MKSLILLIATLAAFTPAFAVDSAINEVGNPRDVVGDSSTVEVGNATVEVGSAIEEVDNPTDRVANATVEVGNAIEEVGNATDEVGNPTDEVANATVEVGNAIEEVGNPTDRVANATVEVGNATDEVGNAAVEVRLSDPVRQLSDDIFQWRLDQSPEYATQVGFHKRNDDRLDDVSLVSLEQQLGNATKFLARAEDVSQDTALNEEDIYNLNIIKADMQSFIDGYPLKSYLIAITLMGGAQYSRLFERMPRETVEDYRILLKRFSDLPRKLDQKIELLKEGVREGVTANNHSIKGVYKLLDLEISNLNQTEESDPNSRIYEKVFKDLPENLPEPDRQWIQASARNISINEVSPAYARLRDYLRNEYKTRPSIAATSLPRGKQFYDQCIKAYTGFTYTPQELHDIGVKEVERIRQLMQEVIRDMGFNMTVQEFSSMIRNDSSNYFNSSLEMVDAAYSHVVEIDSQLLRIFDSIPNAKLRIKEEPTTRLIFYQSPPYDISDSGIYFIGTADLSTIPKYLLRSLSMHEANPGHHFQLSYAIESPVIPLIRSKGFSTGRPPSSFGTFGSYVEGWALYTETLGFDLDLYDDLMDRFGHYSFNIFRAARLVVDTGIHALGWTRDQAVEYILNNTAQTKEMAEFEVDRYISIPGQALSYKVGERIISELREEATQKLGNNFDLKEFHGVVLDSMGPMNLVQERVKSWIEKAGSANKTLV